MHALLAGRRRRYVLLPLPIQTIPSPPLLRTVAAYHVLFSLDDSVVALAAPAEPLRQRVGIAGRVRNGWTKRQGTVDEGAQLAVGRIVATRPQE